MADVFRRRSETADTVPDPRATISIGTTRSFGDATGTRTFDEGHPTAALPDGPPDASIADLTPAESPEGFRILREIARGGMGGILAAHDLAASTAKSPSRCFCPGRPRRTALCGSLRESGITAQLPHPGIPPVYAMGTLANGRPFLAMKLIRGRTLADDLAARSTPAEDLSRFLQIFKNRCVRPSALPSQGVIHRDLQAGAGDIMVGEIRRGAGHGLGLVQTRGRCGGTDRGIGRPGGWRELDAGEAVMGTPAYMAAEQARATSPCGRSGRRVRIGHLCGCSPDSGRSWASPRTRC
ncbi:MAG: hypothetical protein U0791_22370 [Gemmataceae bacterium]